MHGAFAASAGILGQLAWNWKGSPRERRLPFVPASPASCEEVKTCSITSSQRRPQVMTAVEARRVLHVLEGLLFDEETEDIRLYDLPEDEENMVEGLGGDATYGELSPELLEWLLSKIVVTDGDVLCDLGSGSGRALLYLALRTGLPAVGVELAPTRHRDAEALLSLAEPFLRPGQVKLHLGDLAARGGPQKHGTVVLFANKLFSEDFSASALLTLDQPRVLLALRPLPHWVSSLRAEAALPTSWHRAQPVWLYVREVA
eukprot:TRINITY_DN111978_c0_g1_i1.p1 TRINITY_DN111978_c0_g1~~TRINITY_DN111978_c0_g1_i1.p1  ORF type:complete len:267 (-),score=54.02 TRINITY_DN111978_c0_g1_i1:40-816(-)